jgi:predicted HicB family RNase H-like nuclease
MQQSDGKNETRIFFFVPQSIKRRAREEAQKQGLSLSAFMRVAIVKEIEERESKSLAS